MRQKYIAEPSETRDGRVTMVTVVTSVFGSVQVKGSRFVRSPEAITAGVLLLRKHAEEDTALRTRSVSSLAREWMAHNFLYDLGIKRERTADVDFETAQAWHVAAAYFALSLAYRALWRVL